jgi:hypothetical protein
MTVLGTGDRPARGLKRRAAGYALAAAGRSVTIPSPLGPRNPNTWPGRTVRSIPYSAHRRDHQCGPHHPQRATRRQHGEVAAAAGVTRQTVYAHFPSRDALIGALLHAAGAETVAAMDAARLDTVTPA